MNRVRVSILEYVAIFLVFRILSRWRVESVNVYLLYSYSPCIWISLMLTPLIRIIGFEVASIARVCVCVGFLSLWSFHFFNETIFLSLKALENFCDLFFHLYNVVIYLCNSSVKYTNTVIHSKLMCDDATRAQVWMVYPISLWIKWGILKLESYIRNAILWSQFCRWWALFWELTILF